MKISMNATEIKMSAFIIGMLELVWGFSAAFDLRGRMSMMLDVYSVREEFAALLLISGFMIIAGSVFPCRKIRHGGLILCPFVTVPAFGFALTNNITSASAVTLLFIGVVSILIMWFDVRGKPRAKLDG